MMKFLRNSLLALCLFLLPTGPALLAQRGQEPQPEKKKEKTEPPSTALSYFLAILTTLMILALVCMPSKRTISEEKDY